MRLLISQMHRCNFDLVWHFVICHLQPMKNMSVNKIHKNNVLIVINRIFYKVYIYVLNLDCYVCFDMRDEYFIYYLPLF